MKRFLKSILPTSVFRFRKQIQSQILKKKWQKDPVVREWIRKGILSDQEISSLVFEWERYKAPVTPPHKIKEKVVAEYREKYNTEILVETGTYYGDMIEAQKNTFKQLYSIELSKELWSKAVHRFKSDSHVTILQGDSAVVLQNLAPQLSAPALFWLDGHYCGDGTALSEIECPIYQEINAIFSNNPGHILLIDDARCFVGKRDYPTIAELEAFMKKLDVCYKLSISDDIIRIENPEFRKVAIYFEDEVEAEKNAL